MKKIFRIITVALICISVFSGYLSAEKNRYYINANPRKDLDRYAAATFSEKWEQYRSDQFQEETNCSLYQGILVEQIINLKSLVIYPIADGEGNIIAMYYVSESFIGAVNGSLRHGKNGLMPFLNGLVNSPQGALRLARVHNCYYAQTDGRTIRITPDGCETISEVIFEPIKISAVDGTKKMKPDNNNVVVISACVIAVLTGYMIIRRKKSMTE